MSDNSGVLREGKNETTNGNTRQRLLQVINPAALTTLQTKNDMTSKSVITFLESTAKELPERLLRDDELFCQYWSIGKSNYDWGIGATTDSKKICLNDSSRFDYEILTQFKDVMEDMVRRCRKSGHTRNMACELIRENNFAWFRITSS